ncbi:MULTISPECIES: LuxR C-terminal-related transcriptional regulator [unclassified Paenibacillus]|uniref:LuxR C-terminal-related transcriptional regulator n=1 Tax=unclassified Paenibacillus TaxID=185978 RepID=UPI0036D2FEAD
MRPNAVRRASLINRLNDGLHRRLTIVSASAGFGKTTLVREWLAQSGRPSAWVSLDEGDRNPAEWLMYLSGALGTVGAVFSDAWFSVLRSLDTLPISSLLTALLNEAAAVESPFILVLDDYHTISSNEMDEHLAYFIERMPSNMHLVIIARHMPKLPFPRLRARDQLNEWRGDDLRFMPDETGQFLNGTMGLTLSTEQTELLQIHTEGWVAGLQLAALALQGERNNTRLSQHLTFRNHFALDYLFEEVLQKQSEPVRRFLLCTSVLDRMCASLCDAILPDSAVCGRDVLDELERANLFLVPLDHERKWYRYHHLFAELLRRQLVNIEYESNHRNGQESIFELHKRASQWFEGQGYLLEAFNHAAAAHDTARAARLAEGEGMPLHFQGAAYPVLKWLESLPYSALNDHPSLLVMFASVSLFAGRTERLEEMLLSAETVLRSFEPRQRREDLMGHAAAIRAVVAASRYHADEIMEQSLYALALLHPDNKAVRASATWSLGFAHQLLGNRAAAKEAYARAQSVSQTIGHVMIELLAAIGLGNLQQSDNLLPLAASTYLEVLRIGGQLPLPVLCEAHLGLARIYYEWNELELAEQHGAKASEFARQLEAADRLVRCELIDARIKLALGDERGAEEALERAVLAGLRNGGDERMPELSEAQVLAHVAKGQMAAAARLADERKLPIARSRVFLANGDAQAAFVLLSGYAAELSRQEREDERLKVTVMLAVAQKAVGDSSGAERRMAEALQMAEPGGYIRLFTDEGNPMRELLGLAASGGNNQAFASKLLSYFHDETPVEIIGQTGQVPVSSAHSTLAEPLSARELDVLKLIALGLSNHEISERLFLALSTVKGYNRTIYDKLQVKRRTEAVARAREWGLL